MRLLGLILSLTVLLFNGASLTSGSHGASVATLQTALDQTAGSKLTADGVYGPLTSAAVRTFEQRHSLTQDGIAGPQVLSRLIRSIPDRGTLTEGDRGRSVRALQRLLTLQNQYHGPLDGVFGPSTLAALKAFQSHAGLMIDGIVGPQTMSALTKLSVKVPKGATLSAYETQYGVSESSLLKANHLASPLALQAGANLTIPLLTDAGSSATGAIKHTSQKSSTASPTPVTKTRSKQKTNASSSKTSSIKSTAVATLSHTVPLAFVGRLDQAAAARLVARLNGTKATFFLPKGSSAAVAQFLTASGDEVGYDANVASGFKAHLILISPTAPMAAIKDLKGSLVPFVAAPNTVFQPIGGEPLVVPTSGANKLLSSLLHSASSQHLTLTSISSAYGL